MRPFLTVMLSLATFFLSCCSASYAPPLPDLSAYQFDPLNCGAPRNICQILPGITTGPYQEICCAGSCVDYQHDGDHCGNCQVSCGVSAVCCGSSCRSIGSYQNDPFNCGSCGHKCSTASCINGQCN